MVQFEQMRSSVLDCLETLADPAYQRRMWVDERHQHPNLIEDLDQNIHVLYDDTDVLEAPERTIGFVLRNQREADAMRALGKVLSPLYDSLPAGTEDATVISMPEWQGVVAAAQAAVRVFRQSDRDG